MIKSAPTQFLLATIGTCLFLTSSHLIRSWYMWVVTDRPPLFLSDFDFRRCPFLGVTLMSGEMRQEIQCHSSRLSMTRREHWRFEWQEYGCFFNALFQLVEFCVGPYNTVKNKEGKNEAILIGTFCAFFKQEFCVRTWVRNNMRWHVVNRSILEWGGAPFEATNQVWSGLVKASCGH